MYANNAAAQLEAAFSLTKPIDIATTPPEVFQHTQQHNSKSTKLLAPSGYLHSAALRSPAGVAK